MKKFGIENYILANTLLMQNERLSKEDGARKIKANVYRSLIGSLLYLTTTRPNVMFATSLLSRFMQDHSENHFKVARRVMRYIKEQNS